MRVSLHGWYGSETDAQAKGGLSLDDLGALWRLLRTENLVEIFFHDGSVRDLAGFVRYAADPANWFYAAKQENTFIGLGVVNNFSSSGNTAYAHLVSFAAGRNRQKGGSGAERHPVAGGFAEAGRLWFDLLRTKGGLAALIAVIPAPYRGARHWAESFGFVPRMTLPGALTLHRPGGTTRQADACVYQLALSNA